ncbi:glycosyltransferase [Microbulbifer sp.]|uniref:glycosyltransferase n=1 Tax=Microbulbifer sp. TaxID=1908541 RepID=UPI003F380442
MAKILCVWELGNDLGHIARLTPVMNGLAERGHQVVFASRHVTHARCFGLAPAVVLVQAPLWIRGRRAAKPTRSQAEILLDLGYGDVATLNDMLGAWRWLIEKVQPELMLFDCAPTAMLACRGSTVPRALASLTFYSPVPGVPSADLCYWAGDYSTEQSDRQLVQSVNQAMSEMGMARIVYPADIYEADKTFLFQPAEYDVYGKWRRNAVYITREASAGVAADAEWPPLAGEQQTNVFAYLKEGQKHVEQLLSLLSSGQVRALCYYAGDQAKVERYQTTNCRIVGEPVNMAQVLQTADMVVCHAGAGLLTEALMAGIPALLLPTQIEQMHNGIVTEYLELGLSVRKGDTEAAVDHKFRTLVGDSKYRQNASRFAAGHRPRSSSLIADWCEHSLQQAASRLTA